MANEPIIIILHGTPVGKGRPRFVRSTGIAFTPQKTRGYEAALRYAAQETMAGRPPIDGPVVVSLEASFPVPASWPAKRRVAALAGRIPHQSRPDVDNLAKNFDALNEIVWKDDKQIVSATILKNYSENPRLKIAILTLETEQTK